jgi:DNA repair exonuclease SbcCD ATPase subunit
VYIPQGAINTGGLPDDMKNRLLVLLGSGRPDDNGAERAIERLDAAERALRAKRRPAKGKLDELDERLELMTRQKAACDEYAAMSVQTEEELKLLSTEIHACGERLKGLDSSIEQINRQNELATKQELYAELRSQLNALKQESVKLQVFFGEIDPKTVNLAGLQTAITEFYTLKKELSEIEEKLYMAESHEHIREMYSVSYSLPETSKIIYNT